MKKLILFVICLMWVLISCAQSVKKYSYGMDMPILELNSSRVTSTAAQLNYLNTTTSNVQTQLNAKQATLVSGSNIKTVGGFSLLGPGDIAVAGSGTVTSVGVASVNGVSGSVANETSAAVITLTLGAITPTAVNGLTLAAQANGFTIAGGTSSKTLTVPLAATVSGTNTGDNAVNTLYSGIITNATHTGDVTGSTALTIANGVVSLAKMANMATASLIYRKSTGTGVPEVQSLATLKTDLGLVGSNTGDQTNITGNAATATALQNARTINGISFNGTANITVPSNIAAGTIGNVMTSNGSVWTSAAPTAGGEVTLTGVQTLTNKTLTLPKINEDVQVTTTATELNYVTNVTSDIQGQFNDTISVDSIALRKQISINPQVASYILKRSDAAKLVTVSNGSANTVTIPPNSSAAFPTGTQITVTSIGAGQTSIVAGSGVTINSAGGALKLRVQYSTV